MAVNIRRVKIVGGGGEVQGSAVEIVEFLRDKRFGMGAEETLDAYMVWLQKTLFRLGKIGIVVEGKDTAARAACLVNELIKAEVLEEVETE